MPRPFEAVAATEARVAASCGCACHSRPPPRPFKAAWAEFEGSIAVSAGIRIEPCLGLRLFVPMGEAARERARQAAGPSDESPPPSPFLHHKWLCRMHLRSAWRLCQVASGCVRALA